MKIRWVDGEQVTWRRDARAGKPIEILDATANSNGSVQAEVPRHVSVAALKVEEEPSQMDWEDNPVRTDARRCREQAMLTTASDLPIWTAVATGHGADRKWGFLAHGRVPVREFMERDQKIISAGRLSNSVSARTVRADSPLRNHFHSPG